MSISRFQAAFAHPKQSTFQAAHPQNRQPEIQSKRVVRPLIFFHAHIT